MRDETDAPARTWRTLLVACLLGATTASCSEGSTADRSADAAPLRWTSCAEPALASGQCATLTVPLDHREPTAGSIDLFVLRFPARTTSRGVLFTNPGGPGASAVDHLVSWREALPDDVDLVTFDPRGVARSSPLRCVTAADLDELRQDLLGDPAPVVLARELATAGRIAATCASTPIGRHMGTVDVARDVDLLRRALAVERIDFMGFSYGTVLGWTYATLFPGRVRALVLDGPVDPAPPDDGGALVQAQTIDRVLHDFTAWCSDERATCPEDPPAAIAAILAAAAETPIATGEGLPPLGSFFTLTGILGGFFVEEEWPELGRALLAAEHGDAHALAALSPPWQDRAYGHDIANLSAPDVIWCADHAARDRVDAASPGRAAVDAAAPAFAPYLRVAVPRCHGHPPSQQPVPRPRVGSTRTLVVAATGDVATPYAGAQRLAQAIGPSATLVTREGDGHTSYGFSICVDEIVDQFLRDPTAATATRCM